jgi:hypothetical protein
MSYLRDFVTCFWYYSQFTLMWKNVLVLIKSVAENHNSQVKQLKLRFLREVRRAQLTVSRALRTTA